MIPARRPRLRAARSKPRASGDDPLQEALLKAGAYVNPARAGMIRRCRAW